MRLTRLLAAAACAAATLTVAACDHQPIGNTNNHITPGPPLPDLRPSAPAAATPTPTAA